MMHRAAILGLFLLAGPVLHAGEVLDRIVATVNGHVILQSDWQDEVRYECFVGGRTLESVTPQDRKGGLDRLIDQELLREQMGSAEFEPVSPEEVGKQIEAVKSDYARDHGAQSWSVALIRYRLTEADIKNHIVLELSQLRLVDAHLRPSIQVDAPAVAAYYRDHLTPQAGGGQQVSLQEATPKIRELLTQQKMNQLLSSWLESLHSQAQVRMFVSDSPETQGPGQ
jgi:peptidyl-prolyl cis-trans isomerase SurA